MTISSSLNASVAGLAANASRLSTISDNIANASTYGYKRAVTDFESMVIDSGTGRYAAGGVRVTSQRLIDQHGTLVSTSNATDLAIRGRGFLPVTSISSIAGGGSPALKLATTGSFRPDAEGYLTTSGGLVLLGWPANTDGTMPTYPRGSIDGLVPVQINSGQLLSDPTTEMVLAVNLPATSTMAGASGQGESLAMEYFDNLGISQSVDVTFTPTVPGAGSSNEWTMVLTDSASGGAVIGEYVLTFDDARGGGGTLLSVADVSGGAYDSLTGRVQVNVAGGPIDIDIGMLGAPGGMTQLSDSFVPLEMTKNGSPVGNMTSVEVDANGFVRAVFDTGITRTIYQIPLVDVPNPNGLQSMDQQTYAVTPDSGAFFLWNAGDGPTGDIVSFAREESATDVAGELTQLIQTQRAYSSNAKVIQTVDEMLQETTNIKR
jgi:flagellar hook protein FlgE